MSKRICSFLLAVLMLLSLSACPGFRASARAEGESTTVPYADIGLTLHYPEVFNETAGIYVPCFSCLTDGGITCTPFIYFAISQEEFAATASFKEVKTPEEIAAFRDGFSVMLWVMAIDDNRGAKEILDAFEADRKSYSVKDFTEIGKAEDVTFYLFETPEKNKAWLSEIKPEYAEEYTALHDELIEVLKNAEFSVPASKDGCPVGQLLRFETTDTNGRTVKSEELFAEHEITMLNTWDTGCGPCIGELEGLNEMNQRLAEKDSAVVGLCTDADMYLDKCKTLLEEHHAEYPNLLPFSGIRDCLDLDAAPTSYFVGRNGRILDYPYRGAPADITAYETYIDLLLCMSKAYDPFFQFQK